MRWCTMCRLTTQKNWSGNSAAICAEKRMRPEQDSSGIWMRCTLVSNVSSARSQCVRGHLLVVIIWRLTWIQFTPAEMRTSARSAPWSSTRKSSWSGVWGVNTVKETFIVATCVRKHSWTFSRFESTWMLCTPGKYAFSVTCDRVQRFLHRNVIWKDTQMPFTPRSVHTVFRCTKCLYKTYSKYNLTSHSANLNGGGSRAGNGANHSWSIKIHLITWCAGGIFNFFKFQISD